MGVEPDGAAVSLTLAGVEVFVGVGGSLSGSSPSYTVTDGTLGFSGSLQSMSVVAIKDTKGNNSGPMADLTDDVSYLGAQISDLDADLIGFGELLEFHAWDVNLKLNKASDADASQISAAVAR